MKKERTYFRSKFNNDFILQEVIQGTEEELLKLPEKRWGMQLSNLYRTPKEAKVECAYLRVLEIRRILRGKHYQDVNDSSASSWYKTSKKNYEGELKKTSKWLEPYYEKYPHVFV